MAYLEDGFTDNPHPVMLCITDNISTKTLTIHTCKKSIIGHNLAHFFCKLLIGLDVGINAKWISTMASKIADKISRLKKTHTSTASSFSYDFSKLEQDHVDLKHCHFYHSSQELLSMIRQIFVDAKIARLRYSSSIETEWFRQTQWLNWCQAKLISDPHGNKPGYKHIVACFGQNLIRENRQNIHVFNLSPVKSHTKKNSCPNPTPGLLAVEIYSSQRL